MMKKLIALGLLLFAAVGCFGEGNDTSNSQRVSETLIVNGFRGADKTGTSSQEGPSDFKQVKWKSKIGNRVFGSPVVVGENIFIGNMDGNFYCIDKKRGEIIASYKTDGGIGSTPFISGNNIYVNSEDGYLYKLYFDKNRFELKWKFKTLGEKKHSKVGLFTIPGKTEVIDSFDFFISSPVVDEGVVYFGSGDKNVYAIDEATGTKRWEYNTGGVVHSSPVISNGILFVGSWDTYMYALDKKSGTLVWKYKTGEDSQWNSLEGNQGSPAVDSEAVYFGSRDGNMYALSKNDGKLIWKTPADNSWILGSPSVTDEYVYIGNSDTYKVYKIDKKSGKVDKEFSAGMFFYSSPIVDSKYVYIGNCNGILYVLDKNTLTLKWKYRTESSTLNINKMLLKNESPVSYLDLSSEKAMNIWMDKMYSLGSIISSPVLDNGIVYFASADGYIYAVE